MKKLTFYKIITSLIFPIFIIFVVELLLYIVGVKTTYEKEDPFFGFQPVYPIFEKHPPNSAGREAKYVTRKSKLEWFNYQEFNEHKPQNGYRIFCFGGSTTFGRPYNSETAFPNWLKLNLQAMDQTKYYEVINVGGVSYASYRIVNLMREIVNYQPDLFIVYTGNNEFLEDFTYANIKEEPSLITGIRIYLNKLRIYSLLRKEWLKLKEKKSDAVRRGDFQMTGEVNAILDQSFGLNRYHRNVRRRNAILNYFRFNLQRMIEIAKNHSIKTIFIVPPSNEKNFSPFKSEFAKKLNANQIADWQKNYQKGHTYLNQGQIDLALQSFRKAAEIDAGYADLEFRIGQCLYGLAKYKEAKHAFDKAIDLDVAPLRATSRIQQIVREVGEKYRIPTLDLVRVLEAKNTKQFGHSILGKETFLDHVHPTIKTHQFIATELVKLMIDYKLFKPQKPLTEVVRKSLYDSVMSSIDSSYYAMRDLNLAKVLDWSGKTDEAPPFIIRAAKVLHNNPEAQYGLGLVYQRQGKMPQAVIAYQKAIKADSTFADAYNSLGVIYEMNHRLPDALRYFTTAIKYNPRNDQAYYNLGDLFYKMGNLQKAIDAYQTVLKINPYHIQALNDLGATLMEVNNFKGAIKAFKALLEIEPMYYKAYNNLGLIYFKQNNYGKAREMFEKAMTVKPKNKFSIYWLKRLAGKHFKKKLLPK